MTALPWVADGIQGAEHQALQALVTIETLYGTEPAPALADKPWITDGVDELESSVMAQLEALAAYDEAQVERILRMPFLNTIEPPDAETLAVLVGWAGRRPDLFQAVLHKPLVEDGLDEHEVQSLETPAGPVDGAEDATPGVTDRPVFDTGEAADVNLAALLPGWEARWPKLFGAVVHKPWVEDGLDEHEVKVLDNLARLANSAEDAALRILDMPFLDTVEAADAPALTVLASWASFREEVFQVIMEKPWVEDGLDEYELELLDNLAGLSHDPEKATYLAGGPGEAALPIIDSPFLDTVEAADVDVVAVLVHLSVRRPELFRAVIEKPWVDEGFEEHGVAALRALADVWNESRALEIIDITLLETAKAADAVAVLARLSNRQPRLFRSIVEKPWVEDGIDEHEVEMLETVAARACDTSSASTTTYAPSPSPNPDRAVLTALYNATDGPNWKNNTNWSGDKALAQWYGVTADGYGRVAQLNLYNNRLTGPIPPQLANLTNLRYLDLGQNRLTGPIPPQLANLTNLGHLELGRNRLTGPIPPQLANLTNLRTLKLGWNQLTGPIPPQLADLPNLDILRLNDNELTGPIPIQLSDLSFLRMLSLQGNQLTGPIPPQLANLSNLEDLQLNDNQLAGPIPIQLSNLCNLRSLNIRRNQLTGPIPPQLSNLYSLRYLHLSQNQLTGSIPPQLANLSDLEGLWLGDNQLTGPIPIQLSNLSVLRMLSLHRNQLTGPIPPQLANLTNLRELSLGGNQLTGPIPPQLGSLTDLRELSLRGNRLTGPIPSQLANLSYLERLWLNDNELTGPIPPQLR